MRLKNGLIVHATGGKFGGGDETYFALRRELRQDSTVRKKLPDFVGQCTNLSEFWSYIKASFDTYRERRQHLSETFAPVIDYLEDLDESRLVIPGGDALTHLDSESVVSVWQKAVDRVTNDPDGAITAARTLVESVCKHILDDESVEYSESADLPNLWHQTAERLNLSPRQQQDKNLKVVLGNCQSIVSQLAAIRNVDGDAHGKGRHSDRPSIRTARLAVNLAGSMASFLVEEWQHQRPE